MESHAVFERNLRALRRRDPGLADALEAAPVGDVEAVVGPRGATTLSCRGVLLASAYDPQGEGRRLAADMAREAGDVLVAVGFALGAHLAAFQEAHRCPVIVYEPDLSLLRAALETQPLEKLLERDELHFARDLDALSDGIHRAYASGIRLQVYPHPAYARLEPEQVRAAVQRVGQAKRNVDGSTGTRIQVTVPWATLTVENAAHLVRLPSFSRLFGAFRGVPAVVAAAGPSLDKQLPLLARAQERLLVIAIGQTARALRAAGIEPDLVHVVESQDVSHQLREAGPPASTVLLPSCHPALFELPHRECFVAYPAPNLIGQWIARQLGDGEFYLGGATVAQSAVHLAAAAGASPILLVGQDLAFTDGRVYASNSAYEFMQVRHLSKDHYEFEGVQEKYRRMGGGSDDDGSQGEGTVWVEGWDGESVPTSISYASFIEGYARMGRGLASIGIEVRNCTEGGARIPGLPHERLADALARCPERRVDAHAVVRSAFESAEPPEPGCFDEPLARARRQLDVVERHARAGRSRAASGAEALRVARKPERRVQLLRGLARCERRVRRALEQVPWLDTFVQPAIHRSMALARRAGAEQPTPEQVTEESRQLFEGVALGIDQARELLDRFERRLPRAGAVAAAARGEA